MRESVCLSEELFLRNDSSPCSYLAMVLCHNAVSVCVCCVGFVMCGCFVNMYTCIYRVSYCLYCLFVLFRLYIFIRFVLLFNLVSYVFLLLCMSFSVYSIFLVPTGTLLLP